MIRSIDLIFSIILLLVFFPLFILIYILGLLDTGSPLFFQKRMGKNMKPFVLIKFRTMYINSVDMPTHFINKNSVTPIGVILRKSKLDEFPQLINVILGNMSLVGPRPNLLNQVELIKHRSKLGVYNVKPGITGLAQISQIDMSTPELLSLTDAKMIESMSIKTYLNIILLTALGRGNGDRII
jgi:O-antigen biosynthesis protein WbqP